MTSARVAEEKSPHPTHKVGAYLCFPDKAASFAMEGDQRCYNYWPESLARTIGLDSKLGNASATIHAEIAALIQARSSTNKAEIYVTDLPCPNCAKTMAEAGIANVYIDTYTYETPLGIKMRPFFEEVSVLVFERAGIGVYEINLEQQSILPLCEPKPRENDLIFDMALRQGVPEPSQELFRERIKTLEYDSNDPNAPYAACMASDSEGNTFFMTARATNTVALTGSDITHIQKTQDKYEPVLQPFNRLLAQCAYYNLHIDNGYLYASQTPTSREFVNMIGYGLKSLIIGNTSQCRDEWGLAALRQLREYNLMEITEGALQA